MRSDTTEVPAARPRRVRVERAAGAKDVGVGELAAPRASGFEPAVVPVGRVVRVGCGRARHCGARRAGDCRDEQRRGERDDTGARAGGGGHRITFGTHEPEVERNVRLVREDAGAGPALDLPMADAVLEVTPLGSRWATVDPFLFCVHHVDDYPAGNDALGRALRSAGATWARTSTASTAGGCITAHDEAVPGFPQHPHRGFGDGHVRATRVHRPLRFARRDGASGRGDVQWLTAGRGINHSEMFPPGPSRTLPNPLELFQIWLNLPAAASWSTRTSRCCGTTTCPGTWSPIRTGGRRRSRSSPAVPRGSPSAPPPDSWASSSRVRPRDPGGTSRRSRRSSSCRPPGSRHRARRLLRV